ncbi:hypothetical protein DIPPA_15767 [Diplonema papillatum]|nr:hypothetical protein DIPPA_15767 [Diplonema papillatum]
MLATVGSASFVCFARREINCSANGAPAAFMFIKWSMAPLFTLCAEYSFVALSAPSRGATALHLASRNGHSAVVKRLIAAGAKVDVQEEGGATALHLASRNGHSAVVKELIAGTKCAEGTIVVEGLEEGARYEVETSRDEMITVNEADSPILVTLGKQLPFAEPPASSCAIFRRCRAALISKLAERPVLLDHLFEQADKCFCYGCHTDCPVYKRGSADYILPLGWARIGVKTSKSPALESMAFKEWHTCYHGTPPDHLYDILCCGQLLKPGSTTPKGGKIPVREGHIQRGFKRTNAHNGKSEFFDPPSQVFFSPSIRYCDYGRVYMTEHHSAGHRYRFALQVRIQPGTYTVGQETVGAKRRGDIIDPYVPNTSIEWYTSELHTHMITGILVNER